MKNITITRMTDDDVSEIAELEKKCFAVPWSEKSFRDEMQNKLAVYFVAKDNGKCIGYAGFWNVSGEADITNVAVKNSARKKGIAKALLYEMENIAANEIKDIFLEVRMSNIAAIGLYTSLGYEKIAVRKRFYSNPVEDAIIMKKKVSEI